MSTTRASTAEYIFVLTRRQAGAWDRAIATSVYKNNLRPIHDDD